MKLLAKLLLLLAFLVLGNQPVLAQTTQQIPGAITELLNQETITYPDGTQTQVQTFQLQLQDGQIIETQVERLVEDNQFPYQVGDNVVVSADTTNQEPSYFISDFVRTPALALAFGLFILLVLAVAGWHGLRSIAGLASSFIVIFWFIFPYLEQGYNPVGVALVGAVFIMLITFYLSHGFSRKTTVAVAGTFFSLIATGLLSLLFIQLAKLTGFGSEEAVFLQVSKGSTFQAQGLLLAGIIISALGVLDDITLSQASIVQELISANAKLTNKELFVKAMNVGKDHIASLVNTLILVYTGSALPLLLLFRDAQLVSLQLLNYEVIAEEIIRTLVGSMGLVLAVPFTTLLAVASRKAMAQEGENTTTAKGHHHHHHH